MRASLEIIHAAKMRLRYERRRKRHGKIGTYTDGCRCATCKWANTRYSRWYRYESM